MPCPIDGTTYIKIGDRRVCPKCGHVAGYRQINIAEVLRENEELKLCLRYFMRDDKRTDLVNWAAKLLKESAEKP